MNADRDLVKRLEVLERAMVPLLARLALLERQVKDLQATLDGP